MKIVFAGTPEFAAHAMRAIKHAGHEIVLALTQPDRRAGRGMHLQASPVKEFALQHQIPVLQPETLRRTSNDPQKQAQAQAAYEHLSSIEFDAMVVVAYGLILPKRFWISARSQVDTVVLIFMPLCCQGGVAQRRYSAPLRAAMPSQV